MAHLGDRHGRKSAMMLTIVVMGFSTVGLGLLPTAQSLGAGAVVPLVLLRLLRGLGAGAELYMAACFLVTVAAMVLARGRGNNHSA